MYRILSDLGLNSAQFCDKVVLVTGGARGIGEASVRFLSHLGAKVVLADISRRGQDVVNEVNAVGGDAVFIHTDMSSLHSIDNLAHASIQRYGKVDILLNSAARVKVETISNFSADTWDDSYFTNLRGPTYLISKLLPGMIERKYGVIMALISLEGGPFLGSYCAQKMGLRSMLMSLAKELPADRGVSCVAVVPGSVDTPLIYEVTDAIAAVSGMSAEAVLESIKHNPGYEGFVPPEHSAASCLYLINHADQFHGQFVDGYLPLHEHGIINANECSFPQSDDAGIVPNPRRELGMFVRSNLEIERRVRERTSELEEEKELLHRKSVTDVLTGLPNRLLLNDRLSQAMADAKRNKTRLALIFIDLDKFKPVNDTYGHHVGDWLLKEAAQRMQERLRETDTIARIGGDEFAVLLSTIEGKQEARAVAEEIREVLNQPFQLSGTSMQISSSIGIAVYPEHGRDENMLLKNADAAMYAAKSGGRNKVKSPA